MLERGDSHIRFILWKILESIHQSNQRAFTGFGPLLTEPQLHQSEAFDSCNLYVNCTLKMYCVISMHPVNEWMWTPDLWTLQFYLRDTTVIAWMDWWRYQWYKPQGSKWLFEMEKMTICVNFHILKDDRVSTQKINKNKNIHTWNIGVICA